MRILAIRGRNLASFGGTFELDFTRGKLAETGLFSIVGPTGSGKSTILDALCLALYAKTPRMVAERGNDNNQMLDSNGDKVGLSDPRQILRRGCADGFAQVDFIAVDGRKCQGEWSVRRARNMGKLQSANHIYTDLTTGQSTEIVSSKRDEIVLGFVGLSYEQFCRSVLLPQGDFAAFLKAKGEERADLLETLTGTEIYGEISKQAFLQNKIYTEQLRDLDAQLQGVPLLSDEELLQQQTLFAQSEEALLALLGQEQQVDAHLSWLLQSQALEKSCFEAQNKQAYWQNCLVEIQPQEELLGDYQRALLLQSPWEQLKNLRLRWAENRNEEQKLQSLLPQSLERQGILLAQQKQAHDQYASARQNWELAEPKLNAARQIQAQMILQQQNVSEQKNQLDKRQKDIQEAKLQVETLQNRLDAILAQREILVAQIAQDESEGIAILAQDWALRQAQLKQALELQNQRNANQKQLDVLQKANQNLQQQYQSQVEAWNLSESQYEKAVAQKVTLDQLVMDLEWEDLQPHKDQAHKDLLRLDKIIDLLLHLKTKQEQLDLLLSQEQTQSAQIQHFQESLLQIRAQFQVKDAQFQALQGHFALEIALDERLAELRSHLQPDSECPVCGSLEHPFAKDEKWMLLAQESKAKRLNLEGEIQQIRIQISQVEGQLAREQATHHALQKQGQNIRTEMNVDRDLLVALGVSEIFPETLAQSQEQKQVVLLLSQDLEQKLSHAKLKLDEQRSLENAIVQMMNARHPAQVKMSQSQTQIQVQLSQIQALNLHLESNQSALDQIRQSWQEALGQFPLGRWELFANALDKAVVRLEIRVQVWQDNQDKLVQGQIYEDGQKQDLALIQNRLEQLQQEFQLAQERSTEQQKMLDSLLEERSQLWPAGDLEGAAKQFKELIAAAESQIKINQEALDTLTAELTQLQTRSQSAEQVGIQLEQQCQQEQENLLAELDRQALFVGSSDLLRIQSLSDLLQKGDWARDLDLKLKDLRKELQLAQGVLGERQLQCAEHQGRGSLDSEDRDFERLQARQGQLHQQKALQQKQKEMSSHQLYGHQQAQEQMQALLQTKENLLQEQKVWKEINDLIGHSDGKTFRLYAQQYTLGILVHQANHQLERIKPRYQLAREEHSLALVIVDRDMGASRRPLQSLSGGESFLVSLALALALSAMTGSRATLESLFIDEGFGTLDPDTLRVAMEALDALQNQGRKVGIITHVEELKERIPVQVNVIRRGAVSILEV